MMSNQDRRKKHYNEPQRGGQEKPKKSGGTDSPDGPLPTERK